MTYRTARALRVALEQRLVDRSRATGVAVDRLRRRVMFERIVARLERAEPGCWVLKGGMALEVRLEDVARLTKDIDLGLRDDVGDAARLHRRLVEALGGAPRDDWFELAPAEPDMLTADASGLVTWRVHVAVGLAGRRFGAVRVDISPRPYELVATDRLALPNSLAFAGVPTTAVEVVDIHRHAAEKFHAMLRTFGERENSRVRDLVDLVLLADTDLLAREALAAAVRQVWAERERTDPPRALPPFPGSWPVRYEGLAAEHGLRVADFPAAEAAVTGLWPVGEGQR